MLGILFTAIGLAIARGNFQHVSLGDIVIGLGLLALAFRLQRERPRHEGTNQKVFFTLGKALGRVGRSLKRL